MPWKKWRLISPTHPRSPFCITSLCLHHSAEIQHLSCYKCFTRPWKMVPGLVRIVREERSWFEGMEVEDLDLMDCLVADVGILSDALNRLADAVDGKPPGSLHFSLPNSRPPLQQGNKLGCERQKKGPSFYCHRKGM